MHNKGKTNSKKKGITPKNGKKKIEDKGLVKITYYNNRI